MLLLSGLKASAAACRMSGAFRLFHLSHIRPSSQCAVLGLLCRVSLDGVGLAKLELGELRRLAWQSKVGRQFRHPTSHWFVFTTRSLQTDS